MDTTNKKYRTWSPDLAVEMSPTTKISSMMIGVLMSREDQVKKGTNPIVVLNAMIEILENMIFMESTDFKDNNGIEVFEGDIVKYGGGVKDVGVVSKKGHELLIEGFWNFTFDIPHDAFSERSSEFKVIGNIYQNPELNPEK